MDIIQNNHITVAHIPYGQFFYEMIIHIHVFVENTFVFICCFPLALYGVGANHEGCFHNITLNEYLLSPSRRFKVFTVFDQQNALNIRHYNICTISPAIERNPLKFI